MSTDTSNFAAQTSDDAAEISLNVSDSDPGFDSSSVESFRKRHATSALGLGLLALASSRLHLERPQYAFRAFLGLRHSWLNREIIVFGGSAGAAFSFAGMCWIQPDCALAEPLGWIVADTGIVGVFCSVMIYAVTRMPGALPT